MNLKINCIYNDNDAWCKNKNIKRSMFGLGARCCTEHNGKSCSLKESIGRAKPPQPIKKNL